MKPRPDRKKPRLPRVDRQDEVHIEDETAHLWAVSYADFLMVLLSFFIIFFSVDEVKKDDIITKILASATSNGGGQAGGGESDQSGDGSGGEGLAGNGGLGGDKAEGYGAGFGAGGGGGRGSGVKRQIGSVGNDPEGDDKPNLEKLSMQAFQNALKRYKSKVDVTEKRIVFMFEDNIYNTYEQDVNAKLADQLDDVFAKLEPFFDLIEIEFVGHTDNMPVGPDKQKFVVNDNFALSVMRATRALQYVSSKGFSTAHMAAKGQAEMERNSRTLSLVIRAKRKDI